MGKISYPTIPVLKAGHPVFSSFTVTLFFVWIYKFIVCLRVHVFF